MQTDPRIDSYIAEAEPFAQPVLRKIRKLVGQACPYAAETLKWNSPAYLLGKKILLITAAFKAHCRCVFWSTAVQTQIQRELGKTDKGMELLGRITCVGDLPPDRDMLRFIRTAATEATSGTKTPEPKALLRRPLRIPPDLAAALKKNAKATRHFAKFSPSARREYIDWVTEAKRPETRIRRLAVTIQWLSQGKPINWKYQKSG